MYWKNSKTENHQLGIGIDWHQILLVSNIYTWYITGWLYHFTSFDLLCEHFWSLRVTRESEELKAIKWPKCQIRAKKLDCPVLFVISWQNWLCEYRAIQNDPNETSRSVDFFMYLCLENWPHKQFKHGRFTFPFGAQRNLGYLSGQSQPAHVTRCD